jgi:release factor glutamine methyltransferase
LNEAFGGELQLQVALAQAAMVLEGAGVEEPRLDAEVLLAHALGLSRAELHAQFKRKLSPVELASYRQFIERRARREPVAYITGHKEFYGLDLFVDSRVLIPRPETELLVEKAIEISQPRSLIADVGTGSGAIAVSLAVHLPQALIYATDASSAALEVAARNCRRHGVENRVRLLQGHLLEPLPEAVDLIVANLPYVSQAEWAQLPPEISRYEPREALYGGPDGLDHIHRLLAQAGGYLRPEGVILLEIGATQGTAVVALARYHFPAAKIEVIKDYAGLDRIVMVNKGAKGPVEEAHGMLAEGVSLTQGSFAGAQGGGGPAVRVDTKVLPASEDTIAVAARILAEGGLVAFPTDTVYGVGAHAFQPDAVERIYTAKIRPRDKAIPILLARAEDVDLVAEAISGIAQFLAERFWPGGLTLVLPKKASLPDVVSAGGPTVAVRVPDHPVVRALITALGAPLAATSANLSGHTSPVTAQEVEAELGGRIELILDGGRCPGGVPSTVLDLSTDPPTVLRAGAIAVEEIKAALAEQRMEICYLPD